MARHFRHTRRKAPALELDPATRIIHVMSRLLLRPSNLGLFSSFRCNIIRVELAEAAP